MLFIFAEQAVFRRKILAIAGDRKDDARRVLDSIGRSIQRYLGVKTVISIATATLCYIGLTALSVPNAQLYGALTFLLNYIPTFGSIIAGIFPTVTALTSTGVDHPFGRAMGVASIYFAVNLSLGSYLEPKILGRELRLSPLVVVVCVVVWGGLWGVVGAFLAVPLTVILQIFLASQENTRPIAIMLSSGPPRERRRKRADAGENVTEPDVDDLSSELDDVIETS
jgi:predicted PurR-regulated permease PerM